MKKVLRITQSPMNPLRWVLELSCGHDVWITRTSRPSRKTHKCDVCQPKKEVRDGA